MNKPISFGKYYLLERINVGGMAEVFKAKAFGVEGFERLVAVKRILPNIAEDEEFITMFIDEAKIAVQLQHANIAQIFDLGKVDDSYFIALEYVHGRDVRGIFDHLRKIGVHMPIAQVCYVLMQVCEGLDYAHNKRDAQGRELNLVHRDVSPQNILIGFEGEVKLVDFGIAKAAGKASKTQAGILKGKFGYMSPEQVRGLPVDRRSDIFSVGICLYELLTNERLFVGESDFSTLEKVRNVEILPPTTFNGEVPFELERIVLKALAKDVEDRYQNAIDLHDDLQAFLYSLGELYSRKDLASWMKRTFGAELEDENAKLDSYQQFSEPTPVSTPANLQAARNRADPAQAKPEGLAWDDEELETQIFDKAPDTGTDYQGAQAGEDGDDVVGLDPSAEMRTGGDDEQLTSSDLYLGESQQNFLSHQSDADSDDIQNEDKTVTGVPPEDLLGEMGRNRSGVSLFGANGGAQPTARPSQSFSAPRSTASLPAQRPTGGGPPPGLGAYRGANGAASPGYSESQLFPTAQPQAPITAYSPGAPPRQTLLGMPFANQAGSPQPTHAYSPHQGTDGRTTLGGAYAAPPSKNRTKVYLGVAAVLIAIGLVGYKWTTRPGKLQLAIKPADAQVLVDDVEVKGNSPLTIERKSGVYHLLVKRDGYDEKNQTVEIEAGSFKSVDIQLQASSLTGFELTSDPPGGLVWLDGEPFKGSGSDGQQVRTNFKAYRVTPGRHVLEIKGDPRFRDWKYEFVQDPANIVKINAALEASAGGNAPVSAVMNPPTGKPVAAPTRPAPTPPPLPKKVATTSPPPSEPRPSPAERPAPVRVPVRKVAQAQPNKAPKVEAAPAEETEESAPKSGGAGGDCAITVGSRPWSEVWIDGKNTGKITPVVDFKIACGKHKLSFKNSELKIEKDEVLKLKAGEKFKKVFQLVDADD